MKEGTIIQAIGINNWESQTGGDFTNIPLEDGIIKISIDLPQHFTIQIYENAELIHKFVSQPISFKTNGIVRMVIKWDEVSGVELRLEDKQIVDSSNQNTIEITPVNLNFKQAWVYKEPNIKDKCSKWIEWRKENFLNPQSETKKDEILKEKEEQIEELRDKIIALIDLYYLVFICNRKHLLSCIYSLLRALLFWPKTSNKKNIYKPLLIRIAGFENLPLPVYAIPSKLETEKSDKLIPHVMFENQIASIDFKDDRFDIMDIQEWLEQPIIVDTEKGVYKVKDLLFDSANCWGAHSDENVPFFLNKVKRIEVLSDEFLFNIIKNITEVTIESGKFLLNNINTNETANQ